MPFFIPLLKVDLWPARQLRGLFTHSNDRGRQLVRQTLGTISSTETERLDHVEDLQNGKPIEGVHFDPVADQRRGNIGLEIGKREDKVGL